MTLGRRSDGTRSRVETTCLRAKTCGSNLAKGSFSELGKSADSGNSTGKGSEQFCSSKLRGSSLSENSFIEKSHLHLYHKLRCLI